MSLNILLSYALTSSNDIERINKNIPIKTKIIIDSGAFTAFKTGKVIHLKEYVKFLENLPFEPYGYINLDVIGNPQASMDNYKKLRKMGLNPVPVITKGSQLSEFDQYTDAPFIALGGLVSAIASKKETVGWIDLCVKEAKQREVPLHLLGVSSASMITRWLCGSADSSSWDSSTRYGRFSLYAGGGKMLGFDRRQVKTIFQNNSALQMLTKQHDVNPYNLIKEKNWRGGSSVIGNLSARAWVKYANDIENRYAQKLFIACIGSRAGVVISQYKQEQEMLDGVKK